MTNTFSISEYVNNLESQLSELPTERRIAFGAWCCERLYSEYHAHAEHLGMNDSLRPIIDRIWQHILGNMMDMNEIDRLLMTCESLELREGSDNWNEAVDAVGAVWSILRACGNGPIATIGRAAECAINRTYRTIKTRFLGKLPVIRSPAQTGELLQRAYEHPLFQEELQKQAKQLEYLRRAMNISREGVMGAA